MIARERSSAPRVLDPFERVSEVLFGLIMALSFTGTISVAVSDKESIGPILIGAIGCNVAWGLIDAVMYAIGSVVARGNGLRQARLIRETEDPERIRVLLTELLPERLAASLRPEELRMLRERITTVDLSASGARLSPTDLRGAFFVFVLVFCATFPVVIPYVVVRDVYLAKRISNCVAVLMLFLAGSALAKFAGWRAIPMGILMAALGSVLVVLTLLLGG